MAHTKTYRVLYFIDGPVPSAEERKDILQYGPHASFRNARYGEGTWEDCVAVAGCAPKSYLRRVPEAVTYVDWLNGGLADQPALAALPASGTAADPWDGAIDPGPVPSDNPFGGAQPRRSRAPVDWQHNVG